MGILSWLKGKFTKKIRVEHVEELQQPRPRIRDMAIPERKKPRRAIHQDYGRFFKRRKGQSLEYYKTTKTHTTKEELEELF